MNVFSINKEVGVVIPSLRTMLSMKDDSLKILVWQKLSELSLIDVENERIFLRGFKEYKDWEQTLNMLKIKGYYILIYQDDSYAEVHFSEARANLRSKNHPDKFRKW